MKLSTSIRCFIFLAVQLTLLVSPLRGAPISISDFFCGFKMSRTGSMKEPVEAPVILTEVEEPGHASTWGRELHPDWPYDPSHGSPRTSPERPTGGTSEEEIWIRSKSPDSLRQHTEHTDQHPVFQSEAQYDRSPLGSPSSSPERSAGETSQEGNLIKHDPTEPPRLEDYVWTPEDFDRWLNPGHIPAQSETHSAPLLNNASPRQETLSIASPVAKQQPISV
ncbi:hypothetical protein MJO28_012002 [Puccinia striiformis f. sp. tritici]|uniref:Uncharacterized protein n=1 Tax=Puccinia striiformis f. sp. tritici TaxID=168172 RepID=A0ACC0E0T4_9BASI|nr:hypothetical protein Pst134EB_023972 [Puccinia striiformis f. sp. tritici]KAI7941975.1 hypothetical protein MJO28_012002 [Puccinia striiformis f. sp. tritici]KAI9623699.1 hypothetical protein H4Q26_014426 [Puccinia striiformis f. sp. tritici PST-130]